MRRKRFVACTSLVLTLSFAGACIQDDGRRWHPLRRYELINLDDERQIGIEFDRAAVAQLPIITDPVVNAFLNDLGQLIVEGIEPQTFVYRFRVVEDPQLNAFAVPGGFIYFHTGTILQAGSLDELAGVMGHEVAHVKARHYAHRKQEADIRSTLTTLPLIAASVAAKQPGLMTTGMAVNVALQLNFSREDEAEADRLGAVYATRAGFDAGASSYFFERILASRSMYPNNIPPYLYSHPAVEERIRDVRERAQTLTPHVEVDPGLRQRFREAQARLAALVSRNRLEFPGEGTLHDHSANDADIARAQEQKQAGDVSTALAILTEVSLRDSTDPRAPYRIGEILFEQGRFAGAVSALRRATELDSSHPKIFYTLGLSYKELGDRQRAVYNLEQAILRSRGNTAIRANAEWEVVKLSFGVISETGFGEPDSAEIVSEASSLRVRTFETVDTTMTWWGRISPPLLARRDEIQIRWRSPSGAVVMVDSGETHDRVYVVSRLEAPAGEGLETGQWTVEVLFEDDVVHRSTAQVMR